MKFKICVFILLMILPLSVDATIFTRLDPVGDAHWRNRDQAASISYAISAYEQKLLSDPSNIELLTRLSMAYFWKGDILPDRKNEHNDRRNAFQTGMNYAEKALQLDQTNVPATFWYTTNLGRYCEDVGVMKSLFRLKIILQNLSFVMEKDKFYYYGGPQRYLSKIVIKMPGSLRKKLVRFTLEDAEKMLLEAIEAQPYHVLSHICLAEVYMEMKKSELAKAQLEKSLKIKESDLPEFAAETRFYGEIAKQHLKKWF